MADNSSKGGMAKKGIAKGAPRKEDTEESVRDRTAHVDADKARGSVFGQAATRSVEEANRARDMEEAARKQGIDQQAAQRSVFGQAAIEQQKRAEAQKAEGSDQQSRIGQQQPASDDQSAAAAAQPRTYTVVPGDTMTRIAEKVYGDWSQWKRIFEANRDQIKDANLIHPGQTFIIPD